MDLFKDTLSTLKVGEKIRFTQQNGQIIEGIVSDNDGNSSIAVQVSSYTVVKYDNIVSFELSDKVETVQIQPAVPSVTPSEPKSTTVVIPKIDLLSFEYNEENLGISFGNMSKEYRMAMNPVYSKVQSALKNNDSSKLNESVNNALEIANDCNCMYDQAVNIFIANLACVAEKYSIAAKSFYFGGDKRNAYLSAYKFAYMSSDSDLYSDAGMYAALYILEVGDDEQYLPEAADMLRAASVECRDISGIKYIVESEKSSNITLLITEILKRINSKFKAKITDFSNLNKCITKLETYFPSTEIARKIKKQIGNIKPVKEKASKPATSQNTEKILTGYICKWDWGEKVGTITTSLSDDGETYGFEISDITDKVVQNSVNKLTKRIVDPPIKICFTVKTVYGKTKAVDIKRITTSTVSTKTNKPIVVLRTIQGANKLSTDKNYKDAIEIYTEYLESNEWEAAFIGMVTCYMCLWKSEGDEPYKDKIIEIIGKYAANVSKTVKNYTILQQAYYKLGMYQECLGLLNELLTMYDTSEYDKHLEFHKRKEECYRKIGDLYSAIGEFEVWIHIADNISKMGEKKYDQTRKAFVYPELAKLYIEVGDIENAERCLKHSSIDSRPFIEVKLNALREKLYPTTASQETEESAEENSEEIAVENVEEVTEETAVETEVQDDTETETEEETKEVEVYVDEDGFESLNISDEEMTAKALSFTPENTYCMLTYLSACSKLTDTMKITEQAFSYAFDNPIEDCQYTSAQVTAIYGANSTLSTEMNNNLCASAVLRSLFCNYSDYDYGLDSILQSVDTESVSEMIPAFRNATEILMEFRNRTGYGIDMFADYKSNSHGKNEHTAEEVLNEANACMKQIESILESANENNECVRYIKRYLFAPGNELKWADASELRTCLEIVCSNNTSKLGYVREMLEKNFIYSSRELTDDNIINTIKMEKFVDCYWDRIKEYMKKDAITLSNPRQKFMNPRRRNVTNHVERVVKCLCSWVHVVENGCASENVFARESYDLVKGQLCSDFESMIAFCDEYFENNGFDWGIESIRATSKELLAKLDGTYDIRCKKYFFIDFLRNDKILLDNEYIPELDSTFCGLPDMFILNRIESHASSELIPFDERIQEIFSNDFKKNNFRSARLIKNYAEDMDIAEIKENKLFSYLEQSLKKRLSDIKTINKSFVEEINLSEYYGKIPSSKAAAMTRCVNAWCSISSSTSDYGFYATLLDTLKERMESDNKERADALMTQLEELAANPDYDFGVYPKEEIEEFINDQKYAIAENRINCIRRHDTKNIADFSEVPVSYLKGFIMEYPMNFEKVSNNSFDLETNIIKGFHKRDVDGVIEKILRQLNPNAAAKDIRGGCRLINNWIKRPSGEQKIKNLLSALGFNNFTIDLDSSNPTEDSYYVKCSKRVGKINYHHPIPAFSSVAEKEGFRVLCLYGTFQCTNKKDTLMDKLREVNTVSLNTIVFLDYAINIEERRLLARKIKEENSFAKSFIIIDRVLLFYLARHYAENTVSRMLMASSLPFSYCQPFVPESNISTPPELFTGHAEELRLIESYDGANLVYGGRQLGKSALLKMAQKNIDGNTLGDRAVVVDITKLGYEGAARKVSKELVDKGILDNVPEDFECSDWAELVRCIKKRLDDDTPERRINYLLLMLDEADKFIESCKEVDYTPIAELKNLQSERFKVVMAGLHNLSRFNREAVLYDNSIIAHLRSIVVRPFHREEATELLTKTLAYLGFHLGDDVISLVLNKTNFFPGLIQLYCQKLIEAMKDDYAGYSPNNTPPYEVTENHIKKVLSDPTFTQEINNKLEMTLRVDKSEGSFYHIIALMLAYLYYEKISDTENSEDKPVGYTIDEIFRVARQYGISRITELDSNQIVELLNEMCDLNILNENSGYYVFSTENFREFLGNSETVDSELVKYIG